MQVRNTDLLIFDLDGTLIDSERDLAAAVNATREAFGFQALPLEQVRAYVGNGAPVLVQRALPEQSPATWDRALKFFLDYYREHMLDTTDVYPGVRAALDHLHEEHIPMAILTNKPVRFSVQLVEGLGLDLHFFRIYGGNSFAEKKPHPRGLECLMAEQNVARERALLVGDSAIDVETARNAGIRCCGVTWGLQPESLGLVPPDFLIQNMDELLTGVFSAK